MSQSNYFSISSTGDAYLRRLILIVDPILTIMTIVYGVVTRRYVVFVGLIPIISSITATITALRYYHLAKAQGNTHGDLVSFAFLSDPQRRSAQLRGCMQATLLLDIIACLSSFACWISWSVAINHQTIGYHQSLLASWLHMLLTVLCFGHTYFVLKHLKKAVGRWWSHLRSSPPAVPIQCDHCGKIVSASTEQDAQGGERYSDAENGPLLETADRHPHNTIWNRVKDPTNIAADAQPSPEEQLKPSSDDGA